MPAQSAGRKSGPFGSGRERQAGKGDQEVEENFREWVSWKPREEQASRMSPCQKASKSCVNV